MHIWAYFWHLSCISFAYLTYLALYSLYMCIFCAYFLRWLWASVPPGPPASLSHAALWQYGSAAQPGQWPSARRTQNHRESVTPSTSHREWAWLRVTAGYWARLGGFERSLWLQSSDFRSGCFSRPRPVTASTAGPAGTSISLAVSGGLRVAACRPWHQCSDSLGVLLDSTSLIWNLDTLLYHKGYQIIFRNLHCHINL